jgi:hypothetical protein
MRNRCGTLLWYSESPDLVLASKSGRHNTQKGEHSYGSLYIFWYGNRGHSPTLKKTQRPAQFLSNDILAQSQCPIAAAEGAKLSKIM